METFKNMYSLFQKIKKGVNPTKQDVLLGGKFALSYLSNHLGQIEGDSVGRMYGTRGSVPDAAAWLRPEHTIPAVLTKQFYTEPLEEFKGWVLVKKYKRVGVYQKEKAFIVVFRGTQDGTDVIDDLSIAGLSSGPVSLISEGQKVLASLKSSNVLLTGHSLGGYAAQILAEQYKYKSVVFNPAAPASKPPKIGAGKSRSFVYHIVGDLISTHVDSQKNEISRIDFGLDYAHTLKAHGMNMFMKGYSTPPVGFLTAEQEDRKYNIFTSVGVAQGSAYFSTLNVPIPGSLRDIDPKKGAVSILNKQFDMNLFYDTIGKPITSMLMNTPTGPDTPLSEFKKAYKGVKEIKDSSRKFKQQQLNRLPDKTKLKMINDALGLISVTKVPKNVVEQNMNTLYNIYTRVNKERPLSYDSLEQVLLYPAYDLKKEQDPDMLDIDPEQGSNELVEMLSEVGIPLSQRLEQLKAIATNYDNYGTFNREEIIEKMRVDSSTPAWTHIPIFQDQTDINIY